MKRIAIIAALCKKRLAYLLILLMVLPPQSFAQNPFGGGRSGGAGASGLWSAIKAGVHAMFFSPTNWYIRADGGTRTQCTGTTDAAYPGSGTAQPCGFNDYRWLYDNQTFGNRAWIIAGGDIVTIRGCGAQPDSSPGCRLGFNQGASSGDVWCSGGNGATGCNAPPIPSGTVANPTTIRGANFAACTADSAKAIIHGGWDVFNVFDVSGSQNVTIQCIQIYGQSSCRTTGDAPVGGDPAAAHICSNNYPFEDNLQTGIATNASTANIHVQDVYIHRVTNRGIQGPIGGLFDLLRVHIAYTGQTGWDLDDGGGTHSVNGTLAMHNSTIEWAGAMEEYPDVHTIPTLLQFDDVHGTVADCIGTPDTPLTVQIDHSIFRYCSQDGVDVGHIDGNSGGPANVTITTSYGYGNEGQQFKWGGVTQSTFTQNLVVNNCHRLATQVGDEPDPKTHLGDFCRAAGDALSFNNLKGGNSLVAANTFVGYGTEMMLWGCWDNNGSGVCTAPVPTLTLQDNVFLGFSNPAWNSGVPPNLISDNGNQAPSQTTENHNIQFNLKNGQCGSGTGDLCVDPLLSSGSTFTSEAMFDSYNFNLTSSSPAKFAGVAVSGVTTDYAGTTYHSPPSMGALEVGGAPTLVSMAVTPNPGSVTAPSTITMTCTSTFSDTSTAPCSSPVWTDTNAHSSVNSSTGVVTGISAGSDTVTATIGGVSGNATVNVSAAPTNSGLQIKGMSFNLIVH